MSRGATALCAAILIGAGAYYPFDKIRFGAEQEYGVGGYDIYAYFYPNIRYALDSLARGDGMLWNPYQDCGQPFFAFSITGLLYPVNWIFALLPREGALASFMFSPEFASFTASIFGNTAARAEVDTVGDFYRGLLGRLPDSGGFDFWVGRFRAAQCQGSSAVAAAADAISSAFASSAEYSARARTNVQYVDDLYNAFLRRGPDRPGIQFWTGQLRSMTRGGVMLAFSEGAEFRAKSRNPV